MIPDFRWAPNPDSDLLQKALRSRQLEILEYELAGPVRDKHRLYHQRAVLEIMQELTLRFRVQYTGTMYQSTATTISEPTVVMYG